MHVTPDQRPEIAIGHIKLLVDDVPASVAFFVEIGIRPIVTKEAFAVLELRGGTHIVVRESEADGVAEAPFDLMFDGSGATGILGGAGGPQSSVLTVNAQIEAFKLTVGFSGETHRQRFLQLVWG